MPIASAAISISLTAIHDLPISERIKFLIKNAQITTIDNTKKYLLKGLSIAIPSKVIGGAVITPDVE